MRNRAVSAVVVVAVLVALAPALGGPAAHDHVHDSRHGSGGIVCLLCNAFQVEAPTATVDSGVSLRPRTIACRRLDDVAPAASLFPVVSPPLRAPPTS